MASNNQIAILRCASGVVLDVVCWRMCMRQQPHNKQNALMRQSSNKFWMLSICGPKLGSHGRVSIAYRLVFMVLLILAMMATMLLLLKACMCWFRQLASPNRMGADTAAAPPKPMYSNRCQRLSRRYWMITSAKKYLNAVMMPKKKPLIFCHREIIPIRKKHRKKKQIQSRSGFGRRSVREDKNQKTKGLPHF